ncbi:uncharacterized protein LOC112890865 [Panicum hallii]|uniref:uncharacterized protein LOC112890865 n=1 Tax=Panicum hallii TaxID=206008 RepID=UPI000DF4CF13|nr:uncharacterized protein LOC112890865 [Panicum hallii]
MEFTREVVVPAAPRSLDGYCHSCLITSAGRRLERLLGNIGSLVEEAEGRHITNHHLLAHLKALASGMYRGRFALEVTDLDDASNAVGHDGGGGGGDAAVAVTVVGQRSLALRSSFNSAKRYRATSLILGGGGDDGMERLAAAVDELESLTREYTRGQGGRPDQTMWESDGPEYLAGVRRILGEPRFSAGRSLLVFEEVWPVDESSWSALASSPSALADGSKLLFTCRDADLARLGTVEPVVLHRLQQEEFWYYFKAFAFGGADPRDYPRIAGVGREISEHLERMFLDARVLGTLLGANFDGRFWRRVLSAIVRCRRRPFHVGVLLELLPVRGRLQSDGYCRSPPKFTVQDVFSAGAADHGGDLEDGFITIHLCRETLYMDHWYSITFNRAVSENARPWCQTKN